MLQSLIFTICVHNRKNTACIIILLGLVCAAAIIYIFSLEVNVVAMLCIIYHISKNLFYFCPFHLLLKTSTTFSVIFKMWIIILLQFCIIRSAWSHFNQDASPLPPDTNCSKGTCFYVTTEKCPPANAKCPCHRLPECPQTAVCCNITSNYHLTNGLKCSSKLLRFLAAK